MAIYHLLAPAEYAVSRHTTSPVRQVIINFVSIPMHNWIKPTKCVCVCVLLRVLLHQCTAPPPPLPFFSRVHTWASSALGNCAVVCCLYRYYFLFYQLLYLLTYYYLMRVKWHRFYLINTFVSAFWYISTNIFLEEKFWNEHFAITIIERRILIWSHVC